MENYLEKITSMEHDGITQKDGMIEKFDIGFGQLVTINEHNELINRKTKLLLGNQIQGVILVSYKQLTAFDEYVEGETSKILCSTSPTVDFNDLTEDTVSGKVASYNDFRDKYSKSQNKKTSMLLSVLQRDGELINLIVSGFSLNPENSNNIFDYTNAVKESQYQHVNNVLTQFEVRTKTNQNNQPKPYITFKDISVIPNEMEEGALEMKKKLLDYYSGNQTMLRNRVMTPENAKNIISEPTSAEVLDAAHTPQGTSVYKPLNKDVKDYEKIAQDFSRPNSDPNAMPF